MFGFQPGWLFHVTVFSSQPSVSGCISYPPDAAVAFENRRRETEFIVSPASTLVLNLRSARLTLADASRGLAVPKLFEGSEESTYESAVGVNISEVSAKTELFWRGMKRRSEERRVGKEGRSRGS